MSETIHAVTTGAARAAVAVIRLSGPEAKRIAQSLCQKPLPQPRRAGLRRLVDREGALIDEALVLVFAAPHSFTGEDVVEFHLHGGRAVVHGTLDALGRLGSRPATPGEFSRRAFENGRLSLLQAEGIADLVDADTEAQRRQALRQMTGGLDKVFLSWRAILVRALSRLEATIDFADEDLPEMVTAELRQTLVSLACELAEAAQDRRGEAVRDGFEVALIGAPNAGKSTLFNALLHRDAAIVTAEPGTTRDVLQGELTLSGYRVVLLDTAGLRETGDVIEREGVSRARQRAEGADLRLLVVDGSCALSRSAVEAFDLVRAGDLVVLTKGDLGKLSSVANRAAALGTEVVQISVAPGSAFHSAGHALLARVSERVEKVLGGGELPAVTRQRHRDILGRASELLTHAANGFGGPVEFVIEDLRLATRCLDGLTGRIDVEDVLDDLFSSFCIGK